MPAGIRNDPAEDRVRVWHDGERLRIEELSGRPNGIANGITCWDFRPREAVPIASPRSALRHWGAGTELLDRPSLEHFVGDDFTRPTGAVGATTFLGRSAWTVELRAEQEAAHEADVADRQAWFRTHVSDEPLEITVPLTVHYVHEQADNGSFFASLDPHASLARRPRAETPWNPANQQVQHRWSDERWDWSLSFHGAEPTAESVQELQRRLGS